MCCKGAEELRQSRVKRIDALLGTAFSTGRENRISANQIFHRYSHRNWNIFFPTFLVLPTGLSDAGKIALLTVVPRESREDLIGQVHLDNSGGRCEWLKARESHFPPSF
jgi:hypothetical protein